MTASGHELSITTGTKGGIDLVAMCVNDLIVQGAEPLFFLDYFATGNWKTAWRSVIASIAGGYKESGCALIGGETAEMPGMYAPGDYDLAGFCVGAVERGEQLTGERVAPGHVLLGLASSGVHSNGFSLVRRLAADKGWDLAAPAPFDPERALIDTLLAPTRLYVASLLPAIRAGEIDALAHITGGGLLENIPRVLPANAHAVVDADAWQQPGLMAFLQEQGSIAPEEMARTFNCGIGMVLAVTPGKEDAVTQRLSGSGETVVQIGEIVEGPSGCTVRGSWAWSAGAAWEHASWLTIRRRGWRCWFRDRHEHGRLALCRPLAGAAYKSCWSPATTRAGRWRLPGREIPTFALSHRGMTRADHDAAMDAAIRDAGATHVALAGYMRILGDEMARKWEGRMLNIHPSLLPLYPGLDTHARAIAAGDTHGGASVHLVIPELDAGEVLGQVRVAIGADDTPDTLARRVKIAEHQLYPRVLSEYVSRGFYADYLLERVAALALALPGREQTTSHVSPAFKLAGKSGKFFALSAIAITVQHIAVAKTSGQEELAQLCERDPATFYKPAYYGASGWVGIVLNRADVDWSQVECWLERSWRSVAPNGYGYTAGAGAWTVLTDGYGPSPYFSTARTIETGSSPRNVWMRQTRDRRKLICH